MAQKINSAKQFKYSGVSAKHSTTQSMASGSATTVAWDSEEYDTDSYHDTVTNNHRITVPYAGYYRITVRIELNSWAGTSRLILSLFKNGVSQVDLLDIEYLNGSGEPSFGESIDIKLAQGDYLHVTLYQATGSARLLQGSTSRMQVTYMGGD